MYVSFGGVDYMLGLFRSNIVDLPTNVALSYFWCGGFLISFFLVVQIVSGVVLSFLYVSDHLLAYTRVMGLMNEGFFFWLVRYFHIWGATSFFFLIFIHMGRSLYYSSYSKVSVWNVGFVIYLASMVEAFLGYVLPWHQMSYWAAMVLTSIITSVPVVGASVYKFVVGGFSVSGETLVRVFPAHVCLGFVILGLSMVHMFYLHKGGSNNPLFVYKGYSDSVSFHGFFVGKDGFVLIIVMVIFFMMMLCSPDFVSDPESYIEADPLVTPVSIKPEWYFLAYYAMLRSVSSKVGGLVLVLVFLFVFWLPTLNEASVYSVERQVVFWWVVSCFCLLSYLGACHPEWPYVTLSQLTSGLIVILLCIYKGVWLFPYTGSLFNGFSFLDKNVKG